MFSETPLLTRSRGLWVWGLIRSGMKAVGDYIFQNSQFLHIFLQYFIKNHKKLRPKIAHSFHTAANQPTDPYNPRNGLGKEILKTYSIIKNIAKRKNK